MHAEIGHADLLGIGKRQHNAKPISNRKTIAPPLKVEQALGRLALLPEGHEVIESAAA